MTEHLHHKFAVLLQNLLHGKLPRSVLWEDAVSLVSHLGRVEAHTGEEVTFVVGEERMVFKPKAHSAKMDIDAVSRLRKLLKSAESHDSTPEQVQPGRMIVVVDHHVAHIYRHSDGSGAESFEHIEPTDPQHYHHHLVHKKEAHYQGDRVPEDKGFYAEIAKALLPAHEIVVMGHGVGKSSAAFALMEYMRSHTPQIAALVQAVEVADLSALTDPQIEAIAKPHMIRI